MFPVSAVQPCGAVERCTCTPVRGLATWGLSTWLVAIPFSTVHLLLLISSGTKPCNLCSGILTQWHASPLRLYAFFPPSPVGRSAWWGSVYTHRVCETRSPASKFFAVCKQAACPLFAATRCPSSACATGASAHFLCIVVVIDNHG